MIRPKAKWFSRWTADDSVRNLTRSLGANTGEDLRWVRPPEGWAKLNTDGSYFATDGSTGCGMALHDSAGEIIYTACRQLFTCDNALEAELEGARKY